MNRRLAEGFAGEVPQHDRASVEAVIALGSNLGDRAEILREALKDLARLPLVERVRASHPVESVAVRADGPDASAPAYLNAIAILTTRLAPSVLLAYLHAIETRHGRAPRQAREPRWQDRTLDLDIIAYADLHSDDPALTVPHPRAAERTFVLAPWLEVDPDAVLPGAGRVDALLAALQDDS